MTLVHLKYNKTYEAILHHVHSYDLVLQAEHMLVSIAISMASCARCLYL